MSVFVLGSGGHARVVVSSLKGLGRPPSGLTDSDPRRHGAEVWGVPVLGDDARVLEAGLQGVALYNGLGNRPSRDDSGLQPRRGVFERWVAQGYDFPPLVAASALVAPEAEVAEGAQVLQGAIVQAGARVGPNCIVNSGAIVEHDVSVGAHTHVAPGAVLCGGVEVGEGVHVGAGAVVLPGLRIASGAVVPAGTTVRAPLPPPAGA